MLYEYKTAKLTFAVFFSSQNETKKLKIDELIMFFNSKFF